MQLPFFEKKITYALILSFAVHMVLMFIVLPNLKNLNFSAKQSNIPISIDFLFVPESIPTTKKKSRTSTQISKKKNENRVFSPKRHLAVQKKRKAISENRLEKQAQNIPSINSNQVIHNPWGKIKSVEETQSALTKYVAPRYPRIARIKEIEGSVILGIQVKNGKVKQMQLLKSSKHKILDRAVIKAVSKWNFNQEYSQTFRQKFVFRLKK